MVNGVVVVVAAVGCSGWMRRSKIRSAQHNIMRCKAQHAQHSTYVQRHAGGRGAVVRPARLGAGGERQPQLKSDLRV